jgi:hypothetical protein
MFGQQASKAIGDYAKTQTDKAAELRRQAAMQKASNPTQAKALEDQAQILEEQWGATGTMRVLAHTVVGGLTGGILPGGVPPFGNLFNLPVIADPALFENEKIIFNAGDRRFSVAMRAADYKRIVKPEVVEII